MRLKTTIFIIFLTIYYCTIAQNIRIKKRFCNKDRIAFPVYYKDTVKDRPKTLSACISVTGMGKIDAR